MDRRSLPASVLTLTSLVSVILPVTLTNFTDAVVGGRYAENRLNLVDEDDCYLGHDSVTVKKSSEDVMVAVRPVQENRLVGSLAFDCCSRYLFPLSPEPSHLPKPFQPDSRSLLSRRLPRFRLWCYWQWLVLTLWWKIRRHWRMIPKGPCLPDLVCLHSVSNVGRIRSSVGLLL